MDTRRGSIKHSLMEPTEGWRNSTRTTWKAHQLTCLFCCEICARYLALRIGNSYIRALVIMYICKLAVLKGQRKWRRTKTKRTGKPGKGSTKSAGEPGCCFKLVNEVERYGLQETMRTVPNRLIKADDLFGMRARIAEDMMMTNMNLRKQFEQRLVLVLTPLPM